MHARIAPLGGTPPQRSGSDYLHLFKAMATPCEVRMETDNMQLAAVAGQLAEAEAHRIESRYSRYRAESIVGRINASRGVAMIVDPETAQLLDFADRCYWMSGGLFDITSGVLRRIWKFDGSDRLPSEEQIEKVRPLIGWDKVIWHSPTLVLPEGMEIDLGGIAKEYAVDCALAAAVRLGRVPTLINFGGDLAVSGPRAGGKRWRVAIESVEQSGGIAGLLELSCGALATSGDARRFLVKDGVRYGHILDPREGKPVENAPRSVTVAGATCVEAGLIATLAILQGTRAEEFLKQEGVRAWCIR